MANVKLVYASPVTLTITNANLAASVTAGWQSAVQDNSSNLYLDALAEWVLAAVNTAPAGTKRIYCYAWGSNDSSGSDFTGTGTNIPGTGEATLTFPDVTANSIPMPLIGTISYPSQNKAINAGPFSIARAFGGILPPKYGIAMVNDSGMTLSVTSIKITPAYASVV